MGEGKLNDIQRRDAIDMRIAEAQFSRDEAARIERERKQAEKRQGIGGIATLVGKGVGAVAGAFTPAGALVGAQIGGGLGSLVGGVADRSVPADFGMAVEGISNAIGGFSHLQNSRRIGGALEGMQVDLRQANSAEDIMRIQMQLGLILSGHQSGWNSVFGRAPTAVWDSREVPVRVNNFV